MAKARRRAFFACLLSLRLRGKFVKRIREELSIIFVRCRTEISIANLIKNLSPTKTDYGTAFAIWVNVTAADIKAVEKKTAREFVVLN